MQSENRDNLFQQAYLCLLACDPTEKVWRSHFIARQWQDELLTLDAFDAPQPLPEPGRPSKPELVAPSQLARRSLHTREGQAALVHAICHIELNAINLAWDAVYRFRDMPKDYYRDWIQVADEEAYHFALLRQRLQELGYAYGDFAAHNGLWEMACKTAHDVMIRMALVPRVLEARGLDVAPGMMERLRKAGDHRTVALLRIILRDEIGHVAIGSRWYRYICEARGLDAESSFQRLLKEYMTSPPKGPFYEQARVQAGFSQNELDELKRQAGIDE